jgi:hypothetical protein
MTVRSPYVMVVVVVEMVATETVMVKVETAVKVVEV